jgi:2-polyprenyl-3-methyl-5-hydroxy-6-metoxy-1,4-benzoquinol methylase
MDEVKPGYLTKDELWDVNISRMQRFQDKHIIPFLKINPESCCLDIGERNPKMDYIKKKMGIHVNQYIAKDLNFNRIYTGSQYDVIFLFDVIEHLANPLWCMKELNGILKDDGSIYITMPVNARWLWVDGHYFEIPKKHFEKWIIAPLGMRIVRYKTMRVVNDWRSLFVGIRPLMRVLRGEKHWKTLVRPFLYTKYLIFEIKKSTEQSVT